VTRSAVRGRSRAEASGPTPGSPADASPDADPESVARGLLLRRLTVAPATRAQLADLLSSRGVPDDVATVMLDRFEEVGLIDDSSFAAMWVQSRRSGRGLSRRALRHELPQRGVDREVIESSLEQVTVDDERELARALVRRKLTSTARLDHQARVRRLVGMLARRGFPPGLSMSVVLEEVGGDSDVVDG